MLLTAALYGIDVKIAGAVGDARYRTVRHDASVPTRSWRNVLSKR